MNISIRKFEKKDIPNKVKWINDPKNNVFLHYDLPLEIDKTEIWFEKNKDRSDRYDAVIEADGIPIGLIGLLSIDKINKKAEYYVTIGEREYLRKGISQKATKILLEYGFSELGLNRVYLYTEVDNLAAIRSYERVGFKREGVLINDLMYNGRFVDRYVYGITKKEFFHIADTPIQITAEINGNKFFIKRDDLISFSFGGNKARKAQLFFDEIDRGGYDCVLTYGSSSSNHCRVIANMCAARGMDCYIVSPEEASDVTYNSNMMDLFCAKITLCPVSEVHVTIENTLADLRQKGKNPYFIAGGGHGNTGTQAYVDCYEEIRRFEKENSVEFDYIFHASGTGTTQAGLVCGKIINHDDVEIVGISIARKNPRGRDVVIESIREYLSKCNIEVSIDDIDRATVFVDSYIDGGYGIHSERIDDIIKMTMINYGIHLDPTYTGKAFAGMLDYLEKTQARGKNILFIHTGGTPLYFDFLSRQKNKELT